MTPKEELRKEWDEYPINWISDEAMKEDAFNFFYQRLEAKDKRLEEMESDMIDIYREKRAQEDLLKAADDVYNALVNPGLRWPNINEALKKYTTLKTKQ